MKKINKNNDDLAIIAIDTELNPYHSHKLHHHIKTSTTSPPDINHVWHHFGNIMSYDFFYPIKFFLLYNIVTLYLLLCGHCLFVCRVILHSNFAFRYWFYNIIIAWVCELNAYILTYLAEKYSHTHFGWDLLNILIF